MILQRDIEPKGMSKKKKDDLAESVVQIASSFTNFLDKHETSTEKPLKYYAMWANLDKLVSKLDDDTVDDLNVEITALIGAALKKKREAKQ